MMKLTTISAALFILLCGCASREPGYVLDPTARLSDASSTTPAATSSTRVQPGEAQSGSADGTGSDDFSPRDCRLARYGLGYVERDVRVPEELSLLREGNAACRDDRHDDALAIWQCVIDDHLNTPAADTAALNVGGLRQWQGEFREAIRAYRQLLPDLDTSVNRETTDDTIEGADRHHACLRISACCEALGEYSEAARYAQLARHQYKEWDFCGVYAGWKEDQLDKRIAALEERARESQK